MRFNFENRSNNRGNRPNSGNRPNGGSRDNGHHSHRPAMQQRHTSPGASYVWRVEWYNCNSHRTLYKAFRNKQEALIFMSRLKSGNNICIDIKKWDGSTY